MDIDIGVMILLLLKTIYIFLHADAS